MVEGILHSEMIQYPSQDGIPINAYLSRPTAAGTYPGVIVIMEAFGLVDHIKDVARRFATEGYVALAPDLYTREGLLDPTDLQEVIKTMRGLPDSQAVADLEGAASYLKSLPYCTGKIGVIGFCSGGRHTLLFACQTNQIDAAIDCYGGRMIQDELTPAQPVSPIDLVKGLSCPLLGLFGEEDPNPTVAHVQRLRDELEKHGKRYEIHVYPNAGHAFFADYRPSYRPEAAQDAWQRMLDWFGRYLKD